MCAPLHRDNATASSCQTADITQTVSHSEVHSMEQFAICPAETAENLSFLTVENTIWRRCAVSVILAVSTKVLTG